MKKLNVIITGSNGMLGKDIASLFLSKERFNVYGINRKVSTDSRIKQYSCDLSDLKKLRELLSELNPDIIVHSAANVNVDECEKDKNYARKVNAGASQVLAAYNPSKVKFVYVSTDSVFDGVKGNYNEEDNTNPLNFYAWSKLEGERLVLKGDSDAIVIRTNIYGFHIPVGNSLVEWAINSLKSNNKILGFNDVYFNPVYTKQLAQVIFNLIDIDFKGIINVGCHKGLNKYEFLIKLAEKFSFSTNLIERSSVDNINFKAKRPKNTILNINKLNSLIDYKVEIDAGISELYNDYIKQSSGKEGL